MSDLKKYIADRRLRDPELERAAVAPGKRLHVKIA